jgi:hypothetical protein
MSNIIFEFKSKNKRRRCLQIKILIFLVKQNEKNEKNYDASKYKDKFRE